MLVVATLHQFHHSLGIALDTDDLHTLLVERHRLAIVIQHLDDEERGLGHTRATVAPLLTGCSPCCGTICG